MRNDSAPAPSAAQIAQQNELQDQINAQRGLKKQDELGFIERLQGQSGASSGITLPAASSPTAALPSNNIFSTSIGGAPSGIFGFSNSLPTSDTIG